MFRLLRAPGIEPSGGRTDDPQGRGEARVDPLGGLAAQAREGHPAASRTLLNAVGPSMLRVIRHILGANHPDVEDGLQEAMLGFVRALPGFRGDCTVLHFACRVAVMTALAARRRLRPAAEAAVLSIEVAGALPARGPDPRTEAEAAARRLLLCRLLEQLPAAQAEALALHCMEGLTVEEIAAASGCPLNTIKSRLRLAKAALRERIAGDRRAQELFGGEA